MNNKIRDLCVCFWQWINFFRPINRSCDFRLFVSSAFSLPPGFVRFYSVPWALLFFLSLSLFRPRRARKLLVSSYIQFQLHVPRGTDALDAGPSVSLPFSSLPFPAPFPCHRMQHSGTSDYVQLALSLSLFLSFSPAFCDFIASQKNKDYRTVLMEVAFCELRVPRRKIQYCRDILSGFYITWIKKLRVLNCILYV